MSLCMEDQDKSEYSTAILLDLKSEVTGIVNDLCLPNFAVGELLLSATYLAAWKGRYQSCCQGLRAAARQHAVG